MNSSSLCAIRVLTDEACAAAIAARRNIGGAVNWSNLHCAGVERYETDLGDSGVRVYVEEADPSAVELQAFITDHLTATGHPHIEVITEW